MSRVRYIEILACALLVTSGLFAAVPQESYTSTTATTTSAVVGFGFPARRVTIVNDGSVSVHVDGRAGTATTADPEVKAGETYDVPEPRAVHDGRTAISVIAASATAAVRIYAYE